MVHVTLSWFIIHDTIEFITIDFQTDNFRPIITD